MPHDQLTEYARLLKEKGKYPLKPRTPWKEKRPDKRHPVATPFLVIPNFSGDQGTDRPLNGQRAIASGAIDIIDINTNASVTTPVVGQTYSLRCRVMNRGAAGCYAGIAEFYVASPAVLNALASGTGPRPAPLGYAGFSVASGAQATVTCQRQWHVTDLKSGILVRAYDPIVDRPESQHPYDSAADRHVARRDLVPDFSGTYEGVSKFVNNNPPTTNRIKIVIAQTKNIATVSTYSEAGGQIPSSPQESLSTLVTGSSFVFNSGENRAGHPFTTDRWTFSLPNPNTLHFDHHRNFTAAGRPDYDTFGDLARV